MHLKLFSMNMVCDKEPNDLILFIHFLHLRVQCSIASALVELRSYPDSLNPVIRPLMDCLKMEENSQLQERTAEVLSQVVEHHKDRTPCPSTKIVKNLCSMYCVDGELGGFLCEFLGNVWSHVHVGWSKSSSRLA